MKIDGREAVICESNVIRPGTFYVTGHCLKTVLSRSTGRWVEPDHNTNDHYWDSQEEAQADLERFSKDDETPADSPTLRRLAAIEELLPRLVGFAEQASVKLEYDLHGNMPKRVGYVCRECLQSGATEAAIQHQPDCIVAKARELLTNTKKGG